LTVAGDQARDLFVAAAEPSDGIITPTTARSNCGSILANVAASRRQRQATGSVGGRPRHSGDGSSAEEHTRWDRDRSAEGSVVTSPSLDEQHEFA
jgi:hypothetical protein